MSKLNCMICGTSGIGKTTTALNLIKKVNEKNYDAPIRKTLILDIDRGCTHRINALNLDPDCYELAIIKTVEDLTNIYNKCVDEVNSGKFEFDAVIIDSLQAMQRKGINKFAVGSEIKASMIANPVKYQIQHYGSSLNQMVALLELFTELNIHVITICIANLQENTDPAGNLIDAPFYRLALPKTQRAVLPSIPDIVMLLELKGKKVVCRTQQLQKYPFVKNRINPDITEGAPITDTFLRSILKIVSEKESKKGWQRTLYHSKIKL